MGFRDLGFRVWGLGFRGFQISQGLSKFCRVPTSACAVNGLSCKSLETPDSPFQCQANPANKSSEVSKKFSKAPDPDRIWGLQFSGLGFVVLLRCPGEPSGSLQGLVQEPAYFGWGLVGPFKTPATDS